MISSEIDEIFYFFLLLSIQFLFLQIQNWFSMHNEAFWVTRYAFFYFILLFLLLSFKYFYARSPSSEAAHDVFSWLRKYISNDVNQNCWMLWMMTMMIFFLRNIKYVLNVESIWSIFMVWGHGNSLMSSKNWFICKFEHKKYWISF